MCVVLALQCLAQPMTNLLSYQQVVGTVTGQWVQVGTIYVPAKSYYFQNPGITNPAVYVTNVVSGVTNVVNVATNSQKTVLQVSIDASNPLTLTNYFPSSTNAYFDSPSFQFSSIPVYVRAVTTATNPAPMQILVK